MCGVVGIFGNADVFADLYQGLLAIQHRGQDSAGMITYDGLFHIKKGNGLVQDIFTVENAKRLKGRVGIGHTRYPTVGGGGGEDAQPFLAGSPYGIIMAHNGNVFNYTELREHIFKAHKRHLNSYNDVEIILNVFAYKLAELELEDLTPEHVFAAVEEVFRVVKGSYSVVAYIADKGMVAFRDPHGIKPLVYGTRKDGVKPSYGFGSETVSLNLMNFEDIKNIGPGEVVFVDHERRVHQKRVSCRSHTPCLFEWVYFARPDTFIDDVNVYECRVTLGRFLADRIKKEKLKIDVVVPVPDSARDAAVEIARALDLPYREALVKNRYIGRTFIMPGNEKRKVSVRQKLNPIASELRGKRVLLVDDSIVRGNTSKAIIKMVRGCGAKKVYFASYSPPLRHPCVYGIDMQTTQDFVARDVDVEEVARRIGADKVIYQTLESLEKAVHRQNPHIKEYCGACFSGIYPTGDVTQEVLDRIQADRERDAKQLELYS